MKRHSERQSLSPPPTKRSRTAHSSTAHSSAKSVKPLGTSTKAPSTSAEVCIFSWNVNGIEALLPPDNQRITKFFHPSRRRSPSPTKPTQIREVIREWGWPDVIGLQEVKIASKDIKAQESVRRAVNTPSGDGEQPSSDEPLYDTYFSLPRDKYNATGFGGKVYGVCTLVRRDLEDECVKEVEFDLEGRVLVCELPSQQLAIFNVYMVNGTDYDYRHPSSGKVIGTRHDRKKEFHHLLAEEVREYEKNGWQVVIAGDINISREPIDSFPQLRLGEAHVENRADFHKRFMQDLAMVDTFRLLHKEERKYSYRPRNKPWGAGGDRVDMILTTKDLRERISEADILDSESDRASSDHCPLYLKLRSVDQTNE